MTHSAHRHSVITSSAVLGYDYQGYGPDGCAVTFLPDSVAGGWKQQYFYTDNVGSIKRIYERWNSGATDTIAYTYSAFGERGGDSLRSRVGYIGKEHDYESGYINLGIRLYEPGRGLFVAPDPLWGVQLGHSAYHYSFNNPLSYSDPTGLIAGGGGLGHTPYDASARESGKSDIDYWKLYWYFSGHGQREEADRVFQTVKQANRSSRFLGSFCNPVQFSPVYVTALRPLELALGDFLTATGHFNDGVGGWGEGMKKIGGTFRLTNGAYNGSQLSLKHYPTGWRGGSIARIITYGMYDVGHTIGRYSLYASIGLGGVEVGANYAYEGGVGYHTQSAIVTNTGSIIGGAVGAGAGAFIGGFLGGIGAIPGAVIGAAIGSMLFGYIGKEMSGYLFDNYLYEALNRR